MIIVRAIRIIFKSLVDFFKDGGLMLAAAMSYFSIMAVIPFCLFIIGIFGHFLGENIEFYQFFMTKLVGMFPKATHGITEELKKAITYKGLGNLTLILYGLLSYQVFSSIESAINAIFKLKAKRSLIVSFILSVATVTLIIAFILISFGATSAIQMLKTLQEFFPQLQVSRITAFLIRFVIPLILVLLTVMSLYIILPKREVRLSHAFSGALFTAILLEAAKHLFTLYVGKVIQMGTIYGPLSAFMIFLLWGYYSSCIFLIGAEIVHNIEGLRTKKK